MKIPVLLYHSINNDNSNLSLRSNEFEKHMVYLKKKNFKTTNFNQLKKNEGKKIIITFDDGYKDLMINVLPILKKYGFTATCFIVTDLLGSKNTWDRNKSNYFEKELMNKNDILEWISNGMFIGSHSHNHQDLTLLTNDAITNQLEKSKKILENITGNEIISFSYPYGKVNKKVYDVTKKIFNVAVTTNRGRYDPDSHDSHLIPRIDMGKKLSIFKILLKIQTNYEDYKFNKNELYL